MKILTGFVWAGTLIGLALTASPSPAQSVYTPYTFTTLAGDAGNSGSTNGTGSAAQFDAPFAVAVDGAGNVYVADTANDTIRKVTPAGVVTTLAGKAGSAGSTDATGSAARFYKPSGLAVDSAGNVYVADTLNNTIRKVTPAGVVTTLAGKAGASGTNNGTGGAARFNTPFGVAVDSATNVYVADTYNFMIRKVTSAGVVTTLVGADAFLFSPSGVAVDSATNVYVADYGNHIIRKVTPAGVVTTLAGFAGSSGSSDGTGTAARFYYPSSVAVDSATNVYVADSYNYTIRKVTPAGVVTTLAGLAGGSGTNNGTGSAAQFYLPSGVTVDGSGNVYVADTYNYTIRKGIPALWILSSGPGFGFSGGLFGFDLMGPANQLVVVEISTDLINWLPIWTNTFGLGTLPFSDAQSGTNSQRFYRAHKL
ncbi:MAG: NHL repeat-containing protein [Verrucomicrobiia bacterium]